MSTFPCYITCHQLHFKNTLEAHLDYVGRGTKVFDGSVALFQNQFHVTYELTGGLAEQASLGFMLLSARRPGSQRTTYEENSRPFENLPILEKKIWWTSRGSNIHLTGEDPTGQIGPAL